MDLQTLTTRLNTLQSERDQVRNNLIAYEGAIQECQHWIKKAEEKEKVDGGSTGSNEPSQSE